MYVRTRRGAARCGSLCLYVSRSSVVRPRRPCVPLTHHRPPLRLRSQHCPSCSIFKRTSERTSSEPNHAPRRCGRSADKRRLTSYSFFSCSARVLSRAAFSMYGCMRGRHERELTGPRQGRAKRRGTYLLLRVVELFPLYAQEFSKLACSAQTRAHISSQSVQVQVCEGF